MADQTCGFPACSLPRSHGGDFHVGDEETDGLRPMWPVAARRQEAEEKVRTKLWPVYARFPGGSAEGTIAAT